jgi:hypothetical protein
MKSNANGLWKIARNLSGNRPSAIQQITSKAIKKPVVRGNAGKRKAMAITEKVKV